MKFVMKAENGQVGARGAECYISKPRWSGGKIFGPGVPSSGMMEALASGNSKFIFFGQ